MKYRYKSIVSKKASKKERFEDDEFRPHESSLYEDPDNPPRGATPVAEWVRVTDYVKQRGETLSENLLSHNSMNILQGGLANYFFIGALSVVATRRDLLEQIMLFKNGKWEEVIVDDYIPVNKDGHPAYCMSAEIPIVWPMLIEKAYAKAHGTYEATEGGSLSAALADLTGGLGEKIFVEDIMEFVKAKDRKAASQTIRAGVNNLLWKILLRNYENEFLMCCVLDDDQRGDENEVGILYNHAYTMLKVIEAGPKKELRMLQFRNQWGQVTWKGAYSNRDDLSWTEELKQETGFDPNDNSTFWMELDDFAQNFTKLVVARFHESPAHRDKWTGILRRGNWVKGQTAGGSTRNQLTWMNNPQYLLTVHEHNSDVFVHLQQPDCNYLKDHSRDREFKNIGLFAFKIPRPRGSIAEKEKKKLDYVGKQKLMYATDDMVIAQTFFNSSREVSRELHGLASGDQYVILPCTHGPDEESDFILSVYADKTCKLGFERLPETFRQEVELMIDSNSAGGSVEFEGFCHNQLTKMRVLEDTSMTLLLYSPNLNGPFCMYILTSEGGRKMKSNREKSARSREALVGDDFIALHEDIVFKHDSPGLAEHDQIPKNDRDDCYYLVITTREPMAGDIAVKTFTPNPAIILCPETEEDKMNEREVELRGAMKAAKGGKIADTRSDSKHRMFDSGKSTRACEAKKCSVM